jgi:hypothetical protein
VLVSTIIANGYLLADVPNTNFYTAAEALEAVQTSWKDIYALLAEGSDDYFVTQLYFTFAQMTADANRQNAYFYDLPTDFYRLLLLQYQGQYGGNQYYPVSRMNRSNFGNTQDTPAYRIVGQSATALSNGGRLSIYTQVQYPNWALWYIPAPATLLTGTDLTYPYSMIPEIMSYQLAIEIRRKQNIDTKDKESRKNQLIQTMQLQMTRDENRAETPKNVFTNGFGAYS